MTAIYKHHLVLVGNTTEIIEALPANEVKACLLTALHRLPTTTATVRLCRALQITIYERTIKDITKKRNGSHD